MASLVTKQRQLIEIFLIRNHKERESTARGVDGTFIGLIRQFGATSKCCENFLAASTFQRFNSKFNFSSLRNYKSLEGSN